MPTVSRLFRINGFVKPLAPYPLAEQAEQHDTPDEWYGLANGITVPRGRRWGTAHFLIAEDDLEGLKDRANAINCYHEDGTTTWRGWWVESYEAITKQATPAYWVRLVDPRWLLENSAAQGERYNLRSSAEEYVEDTTDGGTPYTWQQVIADLWSKLPSQAGACPALPSAPGSTPENLYFDGMGAWRAINQCLTTLGCVAVYDPFTGAFSFASLAVPQAITYPARSKLLFDGKQGGSDYALPEKAGVLYHLVPSDSNTYAPFKDKPHYAEGTVGGEQGTYEAVDTSFYFTGRDLTARTNEVATALRGLLDPAVNPLERTYSGVWAQVPGSRISSMRWISDGARGMQTIVSYQPEAFEFPQLPLYEALSPGETRIAIFELTSDLESGIGETATATTIVHNDPDLSEGATITVRNTGMAKGYSEARGVALKIKTLAGAFQWWVIEIDQHCLFYTIELTADTHGFSGSGTPTPGSYADQSTITGTLSKVLTPYPFSTVVSQTIINPFNFHGKTGDQLLIAHVETGYTFTIGEGDPITAKNIVVGVFPAKAREFFVRLTADVASGSITPTLAAKGWGPIGNNSGEIPGSGETPEDRYYQAHLGKTNHTGIVSFDMFNNEYVVRQMEHWATRVKATFAADFCNTPDDFEVDVVVGMNGANPTGPLTVQNRYGIFAGKEGDPIDVLWDQIAGEWYPERTAPQAATIEYVIDSIDQAVGGVYNGLVVATVTIKGASCGLECLIGTTAEVVDHSGCIFDEPEMTGYTGWAFQGVFASLASGAACTDLTPCHWAAINCCCAPDSGTYAEPCEE